MHSIQSFHAMHPLKLLILSTDLVYKKKQCF